MNKSIVTLFVLAAFLLAGWVYRSNQHSATGEERLSPKEENREEIRDVLGERLESVERPRDEIESSEQRSIDSAKLSNGTLPEGSREEDAPGAGRGANYTVLDDGSLAYDEGTIIEMKGGYLASSPTGLMFSDGERTMMYGDLTVKGPDGQIIVDVALITDPYGDFGFALKGHPDLKDLDLEDLRIK